MKKRMTVCCSAAFSLIFSFQAALGGTGEESAPTRLHAIETAITGRSNDRMPVERRIRNLELKVFPGARSGSLQSRLSALEKFAGLNYSEMMPPLPPQFDSGKTAPQKAPDISTAASKQTQETKNAQSQDTKKELEAAVKLHNEGKDFEAEKSLNGIIEKNPHNADAYFSLGAMYESRGELQRALEFYSSALQCNPDDCEARVAAAELSAKIADNRDRPFVNPLTPQITENGKILRGRASQIDAQAESGDSGERSKLSVQPLHNPPSFRISQPLPTALRGSTGSSAARALARAALGAALSGTPLHCPMCRLLQGF